MNQIPVYNTGDHIAKKKKISENPKCTPVKKMSSGKKQKKSYFYF
jgi:hypothetical protein